MPIEVELHRDVVWFVQKCCTPRERDEFYKQLRALEAEPIKNSESCIAPEIRPYALRFFRFGTNKAIFELDAFKSRIRVLECRKLKPLPHRPGTPPPGNPSPN